MPVLERPKKLGHMAKPMGSRHHIWTPRPSSTRPLCSRLRRRELAGLAEVLARVWRLQLLLDAEQLVVLAKALRAAWRTRLQVTRAKSNGEVGQKVVLGLGDGANLVHLQQHG